jgi:hypothetical protein
MDNISDRDCRLLLEQRRAVWGSRKAVSNRTGHGKEHRNLFQKTSVFFENFLKLEGNLLADGHPQLRKNMRFELVVRRLNFLRR